MKAKLVAISYQIVWKTHMNEPNNKEEAKKEKGIEEWRRAEH